MLLIILLFIVNIHINKLL